MSPTVMPPAVVCYARCTMCYVSDGNASGGRVRCTMLWSVAKAIIYVSDGNALRAMPPAVMQ